MEKEKVKVFHEIPEGEDGANEEKVHKHIHRHVHHHRASHPPAHEQEEQENEKNSPFIHKSSVEKDAKPEPEQEPEQEAPPAAKLGFELERQGHGQAHKHRKRRHSDIKRTELKPILKKNYETLSLNTVNVSSGQDLDALEDELLDWDNEDTDAILPPQAEAAARPEYASHPREFTKTGTPIPFWQLEMKKGTEYLLRLHRRYGKREKHERVAAYKPDLEVVSVESGSKDSFEEDEGHDVLTEANMQLYDPILVHLIPVDRLFLFHREEIVHGICFCTKVLNSYQITNHHGHLLYRVAENRRCLRKRSFTFTDFDGNAVVHIERSSCVRWPLAYLLLTYRRKFLVDCPPEHSIGEVNQTRTFLCQTPMFSIRDENGTEIIQFQKINQRMKVRRNPDLIFEYKSVRGQGPLGCITTKLADLKLVNFTEHDYYGIKITERLSPNIKVKVMAAWFIIYTIFYKARSHKEVHHTLTKCAKVLFAEHKPSTEEIPTTEQDIIDFK